MLPTDFLRSYCLTWKKQLCQGNVGEGCLKGVSMPIWFDIEQPNLAQYHYTWGEVSF